MDDPRRGGGRQTVGVDMGHDIVADFLLPPLGGVVVDVGDVGFQLRHLLRRDGQAQVMLRPGQLHPQPPPGLEPHIRREQVQHIGGGVAGGQGGFVNVLAHKSPSFTLMIRFNSFYRKTAEMSRQKNWNGGAVPVPFHFTG